MYCKICRDATPHYTSSSIIGKEDFITGTSHFKKETVRIHGGSTKHKKKRDSIIASENVLATPIVKAFTTATQQSDEYTLKQLKIKFNTAYYIAKNELSFSQFKSLLLLQYKNGLNIDPSYDNHVRCSEIINTIGTCLKDKLANDILSSRYFSIMIDGATDNSIIECEIIYCRLLQNGKPENKLIGHQSLENANAPGILNATDLAFKLLHFPNWKNKLIGFGADGAAVNMGKRGGVSALLKNEVGHLISIHCMAHRLELCFLNMLKEVPMVAKMTNVLNLIWKTYFFSPKSRRELKEIGEQLGVDIKNPGSVKGTRWAPHVGRALNVLTSRQTADFKLPSQYAIIYHHMEHLSVASTNADVNGRAKKLCKEMAELIFIAFCHFMTDFYEIVSDVSLTFQKNEVILGEAVASIRYCLLALHDMTLKPKKDGKLEKLIFALNEQKAKSNSFIFQGIEISLKQINWSDIFGTEQLKNTIKKVIDLTITEINLRFSCLILDYNSNLLDSNQKLISSFKIFNHDCWPEGDIFQYGNEELKFIIKWFNDILCRNNCEIKNIEEQWQKFKINVNLEFRDKSNLELWKMMLTKKPYCSIYQDLLHLVEIMLVFPLSSAECERGFSALGRIKNDHRSSLNVSTVEDLIRISSEGPSLEDFDPEQAVMMWMSSKSRRPHIKTSWPVPILTV